MRITRFIDLGARVIYRRHRCGERVPLYFETVGGCATGREFATAPQVRAYVRTLPEFTRLNPSHV